MPIYEYRCHDCGRVLEVWAKISDPPPDSCPGCGGGSLGKIVSRTSFQLKGGGWYAHGYGAGAKAESAGTPAKEGAASAPAKPASTETTAPSAPVTTPPAASGD